MVDSIEERMPLLRYVHARTHTHLFRRTPHPATNALTDPLPHTKHTRRTARIPTTTPPTSCGSTRVAWRLTCPKAGTRPPSSWTRPRWQCRMGGISGRTTTCGSTSVSGGCTGFSSQNGSDALLTIRVLSKSYRLRRLPPCSPGGGPAENGGGLQGGRGGGEAATMTGRTWIGERD